MSTVLGYEWNIFFAIGSAVCGYLLGNLQTAIIISKMYFHDDVRMHGSGNAGSTNMLRVFGFKPGALTFAGDLLKAILSVLIGRLFMGTLGGYIGGLCVVLGHCYPIFAGFRGGKGVACSLGIAWMTFPLGAAITTGVVIVIFLLTKRISICSLIGIVLFFLTVLVLERIDTALVILSALLVVIVYVRHRDNIKRLLHGKEQEISKS